MRDKSIYILGILGTIIMVWNMHHILVEMPDEAAQGAIGKMIFVHVPAALAAYTFYAVAVYGSIAFLFSKNFKYDSLAVSSIEVAQVFTLVNLVTGSLWGHIIWGIWWTWDLRLTSQFMCFMLYLGYLLMRPAIAEATQRATMSAILAIFAAADIPLVVMAIRLHNVRTQHPAPVLETGGLDPTWRLPFFMGYVAMALIAWALVLLRLRQETAHREIDSLRRELHAI
jgi:heme exporter protein C